jgi:glycosyltransferase involved in cell wall biosynthesis
MAIDNTVAVIIPTLATTERGEYLFKAINSVLIQREVKAVPIVIANGYSYDPGILKELTLRKDIKCVYLEKASQPRAIQVGRNLVETPFFSILDDDDLVLPHAMITRLKPMQDDPRTDVVVTNGIIYSQDQPTVNINDFQEISIDPLRTLDRKWMLTGASLFRSATVSPEIFEGMPRYLEWTYMAARLCLEKKKISFVNEPTVVHFLDHPFSIDRSQEAILGRAQAFKRILELDLPQEVRDVFEMYLGHAYYGASQIYLREGRFALAVASHLKMLRCKSGWRNLLFIRGSYRKAKIFFRNISSRLHYSKSQE